MTDWEILFDTILWNLWLDRNALVFNNLIEDGLGVIKRSRRLLDVSKQTHGVNRLARLGDVAATCGVTSWSPPPTNWIKMNIDDVCREMDGFASCVGVARDNCGSHNNILGLNSIEAIRNFGSFSLSTMGNMVCTVILKICRQGHG
ncbi:hypothetical protein V6N11_041585 [Hibiscus sabdariffa]|uniref:Uncharacterized protein n=1 Tax=Hibiscus sabdariffa TaxID=183260 RepID=A0ABR2RLA8_9ROSI